MVAKKKKQKAKPLTGGLAAIRKLRDHKPPPLRRRNSVYLLTAVWEEFEALCKSEGIGLSRGLEAVMEDAIRLKKERGWRP